MMIGIVNGEIVALTTRGSTLPDYLDYQYSDGIYNPIVDEGVFNFVGNRHRRHIGYPALIIGYPDNGYLLPVTRNAEASTSDAINFHYGDKFDSDGDWRDSEGCQIIYRGDYSTFMKDIGLIKEGGAITPGAYTNTNLKGWYVLDRSLMK